ncbi:hypothetical protein F8388_015936 [Cannabis sativa]|uniref:Uncharacterized protein n=1 Tax=Cannabis sativa TaxID=3483 RepID=A0A7J6EH11_CANSA|nr:hypothetical protein F8388_015936 [Cannabis sativa]
MLQRQLRRVISLAPANEAKIKKVKSGVGSTSKSWSLNDPELQRKKRVAGYKAYVVEGKMKGSFRKSFKWIKRKKKKKEEEEEGAAGRAQRERERERRRERMN